MISFDATSAPRNVSIILNSYRSTRNGGDISLIRLKEDVRWNDYVQPACLANRIPSDADVMSNEADGDDNGSNLPSFAGFMATAIEWGRIRDGFHQRRTNIKKKSWRSHSG